MFDINLLTGRIQIRPRREMARLAAAVVKQGQNTDMKAISYCGFHCSRADFNFYIFGDYIDPADKNYIDVELFQGSVDLGGVAGLTFDLCSVYEDRIVPCGLRYFLIKNNTDKDINVLLSELCSYTGPDTMIVAPNSGREVSIFKTEGRGVITISDTLREQFYYNKFY